MFNKYSFLALIPARSDSKGLPGKNILDFAGKPLIEWTISAAKSVNFFDDVLVSTDSKKISEIAKTAGASVPFIRPSILATDQSNLVDVVKHAWENHLTSDGKNFDYVVLLQATSPLRTDLHIISAIEHFFRESKSNMDTLASVYEVDKKNGWLMQTKDHGPYINFCFEFAKNNPQRQELNDLYLPNGAIFIVKGSEIDQGIYHSNTIPFEMSLNDSVDIDTIEDFKKAENILLSKN
jgi:CMP-N,N'-diacetyllegionaminic acid synthase